MERLPRHSPCIIGRPSHLASRGDCHFRRAKNPKAIAVIEIDEVAACHNAVKGGPPMDIRIMKIMAVMPNATTLNAFSKRSNSGYVRLRRFISFDVYGLNTVLKQIYLPCLS